MNQQDIVIANISFSNLVESKIRPAVVISNNDYNKRNQDILVCAITSNIDDKPYTILIDSSNLSNGKLPMKSRIKADKILQIEKKLVIKTFAKLDNKTFDVLSQEIYNLIKRK